MKTFQTIEAAANLKGMAKHTYNRVTTAIAEDTTPAMLHAFAALTEGAKAIALQSGKFSNLYIRGELKGMAVAEAAKELTERATAGVTRKLRKIDHICAVAFLAEYISRQRKADEPTTEPTNNTPTTMTANETKATEFSELSHAGQRLGTYLHNDSFIYEYYTQKAIEAIINDGLSISSEDVRRYVRNAIDHASFQVEKYDHMTPTAQDIEHVTRNYVAYIVECAQ